MPLDKKHIEERLERELPSATRQQMDAARDRVSARLRSERQQRAVTPALRVEARERSWWRPVIATAAAAALIAERARARGSA